MVFSTSVIHQPLVVKIIDEVLNLCLREHLPHIGIRLLTQTCLAQSERLLNKLCLLVS